jgi:serine/threonine-protein kinase
MAEARPDADERYCPTCEGSFAAVERCPTDGTQLVRLAAVPDRLIGLEIAGRFTIKERLGAGGMGTVYRAVQHSVGREVALKIVNPTLAANAAAVKRFLREAKLTSRLSHPNAVAVLDFGQTSDGLYYLVMELVHGRTLGAILAADGRFGIARLCRIGGQLCDALEAAHREGIVHRDLKPSNVMVVDGSLGREHVKVLDFGLAKSLATDTTTVTVTGSGAVLGTAAYLSPEAALGQDVGARGDLYSLGVMLFEMWAGRLPYEGASVHQLIAQHAFEAAPRLPDAPAALADLVARMLAKDPAARPPAAVDVHQALLAIGGEPGREASAVGRPVAAPIGLNSTLAAATPANPIALDSTLAADPSSAAATPARPVAAVEPATATATATRSKGGRIAAIAAFVVAAAAGALLLAQTGGDEPRPTATPAAEPAPAATAPAAPSAHDAATPAGAPPTTTPEPAPAAVGPADAAPSATEPTPSRSRSRRPRDRGGKPDAGYPW